MSSETRSTVKNGGLGTRTSKYYRLKELFIDGISILTRTDRRRYDIPGDAPYVVEFLSTEGSHPRYPDEVNRFARFLDEHALEPVIITDSRNYL